jgi:PTH1 family peptidyl-tRNA hydrolase
MEKEFYVIIGLGNPGDKYAHTRHNAGFAAVDALVERAGGARYWKSEAGCQVAEVKVGGRKLLLAKPMDFMNTSGGPVSKLARARRIQPAAILVVHDEVDLEPGDVRTRFGGGLNAHNGLRSIKAKLGTADFWRLRVGIGRPPGKMSVADWALRKLKGTFAEEFLVTCEQAADALERLLKEQG